MGNRDVRRLALIVSLVAVAVWGLTVQTWSVGVFNFNFARGDDDGPLGLTLGLDLQGGVQLIYEAVEEGVSGLVVEDPDDVEAVTAALAALLDDPERRRRLGAAARRRAEEQFSYDHLARRLARVLG